LLLVLLVVVALVGGAAYGYVQYIRKAEQKVTARLLPGIAQPGAKPSSSDKAVGLVTATVEPVEEGRPVQLETRVDGEWQSQSVADQDADGHVEFLLDEGGLEPGVRYRVVSLADADLAEATSPVLTGDQWGRPDFDDEFDRDAIGEDWINRGEEYNAEGLRACSKGSGDAVAMGEGTLQLSVVLDPERADEKCPAVDGHGKPIGNYRYRLNGHVTTNGHFFRYGVLAARIKFQELRGQHASLWMQPVISESSTDSATGGAEVDVIEWFGDGTPNGGLASFIYKLSPDGPVKVGGWIEDPDSFLSGPDDSWFDRYHVFSVEWTSEAYIFRIDGQETWRTSEGISHQPEYPILSLLSSDYELRMLPDADSLPQTMQVDWVKFWES
jgi:hypothetical protein